jgi:2-polyprenyl-3-methyl-5-hydroxy-6-metoxy-1,4-benzoquinol methylase
MRSSDKAWQYWGEKDPYFGVLTSEQFRKENLTNEAKKEFFSSGELHINSILDSINKHLDPNFSLQNAIDFGCGTGRLIIPLAKRCKEVVGIDISEQMLHEANKNCELESLNNAKFIISTDNLTNLEGKYNFIHSFIVFQHIPVFRGEKIIQTLVNHLSPSGVGVFHVTYDRKASKFRKIVNWLRVHLPFFNNIVNLVQGNKLNEPIMQMNQYSLSQLFSIFQTHGVKKIFTEFTEQEGYYGAIIYILNKDE